MTRLPARLYRLLLRTYPASFRDEFAAEMVLLFEDRWRRQPSLWDRLALSFELLADALINAVKEHLNVIHQDVSYTIRTFRRSPAFALAAIATFAIAIAANVITFSVVNAVLLRPLPFHDAGRLVRIWESNPQRNMRFFSASVLNYLSWKQQSAALELAAFNTVEFNLTGGGEPERINGAAVSPRLMPLLGIAPLFGRQFDSEEEQPENNRVVMIGEDLWNRRFGGDPRMVGRSITLNGISHQVIGIAPARFQMPANAQLWVPLTIDPAREHRGDKALTVIGRLKSGVTAEQAEAEMTSIARRLEAQYPETNQGWGIRIARLYDWIIPDQLQHSLKILLSAVSLVLIIACANIANLLLSRSITRKREIAIRQAIGASRRRLIRQLLTESIVLAAIGAAAGVLAAYWMTSILRSMLPGGIPRANEIAIDGTVLAFTLAALAASVLLFGLLPALQLSRGDSNSAIQGGRALSGRSSLLARNLLVILQLALAAMLIAGATLLARSFVNLQKVPLGFDPRGLLTAQITLPEPRYGTVETAWTFYRRLLESISVLPSVHSAAISSGLPFAAGANTRMPVIAATRSTLGPGETITVNWRIVSADYFKTLRIPMISGRSSRSDQPAGRNVVIISENLARRLWPGIDPAGEILRLGNQVAYQVAGVAGSVVFGDLTREPAPAVYFPATQSLWPTMTLVIRTEGSASAILPDIRQALKQLDPAVPLANPRTLEDWLDTAVAQPRLQSAMLSSFSLIALLLAAIGLFGVVSYSAAQRTAEIGVRIAVGASRADILRLVLRQGLWITAAGIAAGIAGAIGLSGLLATLLFGIQPRDPAALVAVPLLLGLVAVGACLVPAIRATRVDPLQALRLE